MACAATQTGIITCLSIACASTQTCSDVCVLVQAMLGHVMIPVCVAVLVFVSLVMSGTQLNIAAWVVPATLVFGPYRKRNLQMHQMASLQRNRQTSQQMRRWMAMCGPMALQRCKPLQLHLNLMALPCYAPYSKYAALLVATCATAPAQPDCCLTAMHLVCPCRFHV